jgi:hypothetical protein
VDFIIKTQWQNFKAPSGSREVIQKRRHLNAEEPPFCSL